MELVKVDFNQDVLEVIENDKHWVSINVMCKNLGLHRSTQHQKLKSDPTYEAKLLKVQTAGGVQEVFCIPLDKLNGWLFSINPNRTKPEVREKLILYKKECFRVLYEHFNHKNHKDDELKIGLGQYKALESEKSKIERKYYEQLELTNKLLLEKLGYAKEPKKDIPKRRAWSKEEDEKLLKLIQLGYTTKNIAKELNRGEDSIRSRKHYLIKKGVLR